MKIEYFYASGNEYVRGTDYNTATLVPADVKSAQYMDVFNPADLEWSIDAICVPKGGRIELSYSEPTT